MTFDFKNKDLYRNKAGCLDYSMALRNAVDIKIPKKYTLRTERIGCSTQLPDLFGNHYWFIFVDLSKGYYPYGEEVFKTKSFEKLVNKVKQHIISEK